MESINNHLSVDLHKDLTVNNTDNDIVNKRGEWHRYYKSGVTVSEGWISSCCDMWNCRKSSFCPDCGRRMKITWED